MKMLVTLGGLLLVLGIVGVIWGVVVMYDDRDSIDLGRDAEIVIDDGDFPSVGIAAAIIGGVGLAMIAVGSIGGRRSR
jgi:hypothetical protein